MAEDKKRNAVSSECLGKTAELAGLVAYVDGGVVSKTLIDKPVGTITLFSFDAGQGLSEHTAPYNAFIEVLDGAAKIRIAEKLMTVEAGEIVIMPANVPHAVQAEEKFKMLLVMIRA